MDDELQAKMQAGVKNEESGATKLPRWRVTVTIDFPRERIEAERVGDKMRYESRVEEQTRMIGDVEVSLRRFEGDRDPRIHFEDEPAKVVFKLSAPDAIAAIEKVRDLQEAVIDRLSFDVQQGLSIYGVEVLDLRDRRRATLFSGNPDLHLRSETVGGHHTVTFPSLADNYSHPSHIRDALHWYTKALATDFQHDRFIFLWIALEIFANKSSISGKAIYKAPCGHEIPECPTCHTPTEQFVPGVRVRRYLAERYEFDEATVKRLWEIRQMLHGKTAFDPRGVTDLAWLVQRLRAGIAADLKTALSISEGDPPFVYPRAELLVHPDMGLEIVYDKPRQDDAGKDVERPPRAK